MCLVNLMIIFGPNDYIFVLFGEPENKFLIVSLVLSKITTNVRFLSLSQLSLYDIKIIFIISCEMYFVFNTIFRRTSA